MLIPITRKSFEELFPLVATSDQYRYYWGKPPDVLRRLIISVIGGVVVAVLQQFLGEGFGLLTFLTGVAAGLYWLWEPVLRASLRNQECRKFEYAGFLQGEVLDLKITEELIGTEETVNDRGDLVIVENRERRLNLKVGDESGFMTKIQVPLQRSHRAIRRGDIAEMVVLSNRSDLGRIVKVSDLYLPDYNVWVSDYPYVRRDALVEVSRRLRRRLNYD